MSTKPTKFRATLTVTDYDDDFVLTIRDERIDENTTVYGPAEPTKLEAVATLFKCLRAENIDWRPNSGRTYRISDKVIYVRSWIQDTLDGCANGTINVEDDEVYEIALRGNWDVTVSVVPVSIAQKRAKPVTYFNDGRDAICAELAAVLQKHNVKVLKSSPGDDAIPSTEDGWFDWDEVELFMKGTP